MDITREQLLERRAALAAGLDRLRAEFARTDGALQECDFWLARLEQPESDERVVPLHPVDEASEA